MEVKTYEEWLSELEDKIVYLKGKGIKSLFYPSSKMTHETSTKLKKHFSELGYGTELNQCKSCGIGTYDIIITWSL